MKFSTVLFSATIALSSMTAFASGGGGYGGGGGSYGSSAPQRQVDQTYEVGKAIYNGRQGGANISYCVTSGDVKVPVKSKSLKPFKKTTYENLAQNLYNCDKPDTLAADELSNDNMLYVLYYLNKRYRLSLSSR